jgi:hypothetical protein
MGVQFGWEQLKCLPGSNTAENRHGDARRATHWRCSMRYRSRSIGFGGILAVALTIMSATPVAAWQTSCGDLSGGHVCVWENGPYQVPKAAKDGSDANYSGDYYPNTSDSMNDSISSVYNYYPANDVIWHTNANNGGYALCVDSVSGYGTLGGLNDAFSSHSVSLDDYSC